MKKGISPLIASVLLLAFTMSIAMIVGPFFSQTVKDAQGDTQEKAQKIQSVADANLEIEKTSYNSNSGNYTVTVQNTGENKIKNFTTNIYSDSGAATQKKVDKTLGAGEIHTFTVQTDSAISEDTLNVEANNLPVSAEEDLENTVTGAAPASPSGLSLTT